MKVTGFSFIKNALLYDYPIVEAITSILPICDEFVVAVGRSDDDTLALIASIDPKIRIVQTIWDESLRKGGRVLAEETNKAFAAVASDCDWAFYIQGDEVVHEQYLDSIRSAMIKYKDDKRVDGLLLNYLHFYGSYDYIGSASQWYKNEIRIIRNDRSIYSYRDAQGFRKGDNQKLSVKPIDAYVYHYGWVKEPKAMQKKQESFQRLWHEDDWVEEKVKKVTAYDYSDELKYLIEFEGSHPAVMQKRIEVKNWKFEVNPSFNKPSTKDQLKSFVKKWLGLDFNYKNYKLL